MSKATRLIKHLNKIINDYNNFGDNPESFVDAIYEISIELKSLRKDKLEHLAEIYVERDRAIVKQLILNAWMNVHPDSSGELFPVSRSGGKPPKVMAIFSGVNTSDVSPYAKQFC